MADYRIKFMCDTCNGEGEIEGIRYLAGELLDCRECDSLGYIEDLAPNYQNIFECARDYTNAIAIEEIL